MTDGDFAQGYLDGWRWVAGDARLPAVPSPALPEDKTAFQYGFECGRAEALMRFSPDKEPRPG